MFKWGLWVLGRKNTEQSSPAFSISIVQIVNKTFHCWYSSWTFGLRMVPPLWSLLFPLFCDALFGRKSLCAVHTKGRRIMHEYFEGWAFTKNIWKFSVWEICLYSIYSIFDLYQHGLRYLLYVLGHNPILLFFVLLLKLFQLQSLSHRPLGSYVPWTHTILVFS